MPRPQQIQKIAPTFALCARKPGKELVANVSADPILAPMPCRGIIHTHVRRDRQPCAHYRLLLHMEGVFSLRENAIDLSHRDVDPQLPYLFHNQWLSHMLRSCTCSLRIIHQPRRQVAYRRLTAMLKERDGMRSAFSRDTPGRAAWFGSDLVWNMATEPTSARPRGAEA